MYTAARIVAILCIAMLTTRCAGPLTSANTGVRQCSSFLVPAEGGISGPLVPAGDQPVNMLILSGGGKYGAYGAGVLKGWSEAERDGTIGSGGLKRSAITIVTGISTGALQATAATIGNAEPDPQRRIDGPDADLVADYAVDQKDIGKVNGLLTSLSSNGLLDIRKGLEPKFRAVVDRYWERLRALPPDRRTYVGMVNLENGAFYVADLVAVAKSNVSNAKECYVEFVLASAAVPGSFAPRFIDGDKYVDGGVRFGTFLGQTGRNLARAMRAAAAEAPSAKVNFRAIVNGTLSPNDPADNAALAERCDASTLPVPEGDCAPVKNKLIDIAKRSAGDILPNQIYRDSVRQLDLELGRAGVLGTSGFLYVPNRRIAAKGCHRATKDNFDRVFMGCLTEIGEADGAAQAWLLVDDLPRAGS